MSKPRKQGIRMQCAFTLIELIIAIVIVGIFAAIALPNQSKSIEKSRGKNAEAQLITIYNAQKRYKLDNGNYYACNPCNATEINGALGAHIGDIYFTYEIKNENSTGYRAIATRVESGMCGGMTMELTDAGSNITKGCAAW